MRIRNETGYSLVEVLVAIILLSIAIIPMVSMFDAGLRSTTTSSNYDLARTLANMKLEEAKSLTYSQVRDNFPETSPTMTSYNSSSGYYQSSWKTDSGMKYKVEKQFLELRKDVPAVTPASAATQSFLPSSSDQGLLKVTVTVQWNGNSYTTSGVVTK